MKAVMDAVFVAGLVLLAVAGWMIVEPLGVAVAGLALVLIAAAWTRGAPR